jgi:hypothetical protein
LVLSIQHLHETTRGEEAKKIVSRERIFFSGLLQVDALWREGLKSLCGPNLVGANLEKGQ